MAPLSHQEVGAGRAGPALPPGGLPKTFGANHAPLLCPGWVTVDKPSPLSEPQFLLIKWGPWQCLSDQAVSCWAHDLEGGKFSSGSGGTLGGVTLS